MIYQESGMTGRGCGEREPACKPGSVENGHSSGICVTTYLKQPTRGPCGPHVTDEPSAPLFGLAPGGVYPATTVASGAVRSYRTISPLPALAGLGGIFSAALSVGSRLPGVTWHPVLRSPDFPPPPEGQRPSGRLPRGTIIEQPARRKGKSFPMHQLISPGKAAMTRTHCYLRDDKNKRPERSYPASRPGIRPLDPGFATFNRHLSSA